jgi:predicted O-methyltransferase YrrM
MFKKHWTLLYVYSKIKNYVWEKFNPENPWLTPDSIKLLNELIKPTDIGLEFGSGRSTNWLAKRMQQLTSVEDFKPWFDIVENQLKSNNRSNVNYLFKESANTVPIESDYCKVVETFKNESLDFVLIDGSHRDELALLCCPKIKIGGMLVIDNINWFISHPTNSPLSVGTNKIDSDKWKKFNNQLSDWRVIWTTNNITDTAIFIRKT